MPDAAHSDSAVDAGDVLRSVAEQLKVPLTVIARQAELGQVTGQPDALDASGIRVQADAALQLVDSYLLGLQLMRAQILLELEPVSVSSLLVDTAHTLERFAKQYNVDLEVAIAGRYKPVMAHGRALKAAMLSLGFALVEAQAGQEGLKTRPRLLLATHHTPHGTVAGLYGQYDGLTTGQWRTALKLLPTAGQPLTGVSTGSGAGLFVAEAILRAMGCGLRVGQYQHCSGLATTLQPSRQLQFV